jgi:hypothetical protein
METLNRYFRDLTKVAFARHGFAQTDLFARWAEIVGLERAQMCRPERIRWPRGEGDDGQKLGGTLIVQAAPGRGLDIQHETPHILERINMYFGYGAISSSRSFRPDGARRSGPRHPSRHCRPKRPRRSTGVSPIFPTKRCGMPSSVSAARR